MVGYEFALPADYKSGPIKYNTGQPMGAYSSWTVFALTHHLIIRICAMKVGQPYFTNYCLLGDDVVIKSRAVAEMYLKTMNELGVDISEQKSHVSKDTYEFAKRWIRNGIELSGAQVQAFMSTNKYYLLAQEWVNLMIRWDMNISIEPEALGDMFQALSLNRYLVRKAVKFLLLPRPVMGNDLREQITRFVTKVYPTVIGCFSTPSSQRAYDWYVSAAAEAKARILDASILDLIGTSKTYIRKLRNILKSYDGTDAQSALRSVPAVELILNQYELLNNQIEDLRDPLVTKPEGLIFEKEIRLGFDPTRLFNTRRHEIVLSSNATLVNSITIWTKEFDAVMTIVMTDQIDENAERALAKKLFRTKVIGTVMPGFPL